ncbi:hypothetical protein JoomaDRAFT_3914 [Galbibacter orientalis DSM 19592]|uniref:Chemotaxis protein n=1 Tax=Galbibacter orientalis DSM 19592 TaxID=926559 RepID=I3CB49_9FLAO|nr:hypothetical protein [Galbibacter orientalis]EIJ40842.1 hypothetical protein JoomaDRAFT_3914 [Galbibacter orientalis DSM 19592]
MRFRTYISAILILFVLQSCSLLKIESAQEPLTTSQLNSRLLTQSFIADASERVEWAADSIIYEEADFEIQKNAYRWKLKTLTSYREVGFQTMPQLALVDAWALSLAMENFLVSDKARPLFGKWQPYVANIAHTNSNAIEKNARSLLSEKNYKKLDELVENYVQKNPIYGLNFRHKSIRDAYLEANKTPDSTALKTVGTLSEVMTNFSNRLVYTSESTGKQLQWNTELMLREQGIDSASLQKAFNSMDNSLNRLVTTAETTPEMLDESIKDFRRDMQILFLGLHNDIESSKVFFSEERASIDTIIERERVALDSMVLRERKALSKEVNILAEEAINNTMTHVKDIISSVLFYVVLFFAIILFLPFLLGYFTGRIFQKNKNDKENEIRNSK